MNGIRLRVLPRIPPIDGRQAEFRASATHIQWRIEGDDDWNDLIALSELVGPAGSNIELRNDGTSIQWRVEGSEDEWTDLANIEELVEPTLTAAVAEATADAEQSATEAAASAAIAATRDLVTFDTVADLIADTTLTYDTVVAGRSNIEAQGFRYEVAASGATDEHLTTAGGVKLYVLPNADNSITPIQFGAAGDGDGAGGGADDTAIIIRMFEVAAATGAEVNGLGRTYLFTGAEQNIFFSGMRWRNTTIDASTAPASAYVFRGGGSEGSSSLITSNVLAGSQSFTVADASGFSVGEFAWLESDMAWGVDNVGTVAEVVEIVGISDNTITTAESTAYRYDTADNGRLTKINWIEDIELSDIRLIGDGIPRLDSPPPGYNNNPMSGVVIQYARNVKVRNLRGEGFGSRVIGFENCFVVEVENPQTKGLPDGQGLNYGVAFLKGTHYATVRGGHGHNHRHFLTVGGNGRVNRFITYDGCSASGAHDAEAFDSHRDADVVEMLNLKIQGGDPAVSGVMLQCATPVVRNLRGQGQFLYLINLQPLTAYTYGAVTIDVDGAVAVNSRCTGAVVRCRIQSTVNVEMLSLRGVGNTGRNYAYVRSEVGIDLDFLTAITCHNLVIADYSLARINGRAIDIANTGGTNATRSRIGPGAADLLDTSTEVIYVNEGAGAFQQWTFIGNTTSNGSYSIRAIGTSQVATAGNNDSGSSNGQSIDGV